MIILVSDLAQPSVLAICVHGRCRRRSRTAKMHRVFEVQEGAAGEAAPIVGGPISLLAAFDVEIVGRE